jgi:PPOX class probable F420-dependent enzyme
VSHKITDEIRRLFEEKNLVFIATLMKDGSPQLVPTWADIENGSILVNTFVSSLKHKNVSRDPRIAVSIADKNNPFEMISIRGKVIEQITGDEARKHVDKLAKKYLGVDEYLGPEGRRVILKIKPEKIFHKNYAG